jgi:hypothetical protein
MAGIANFGSFASGLMQGHLAGEAERRREEAELRAKEDQAFQLEQRGIWRDEQERAKRIRQGIAGIARPGAEVGRTQFMAEGIDGPEAIPGLSTIQRQSDADYYRQLGDVYTREGDIERAEGMRDRLFNLDQRNFQLGQQGRTLRQQSAADAALGRRAEMIRELQADMPAFLAKYSPMFNADQIGGERYRGSQVAFASTPQGQVGYLVSPDGKSTMQFPVTQQSLMDIINGLTDAELSATSPEAYAAAATRGIQRGQLAATGLTAQAAMRNADTNASYRAWMEGRPLVQTDGSGRVITLDPTGTRQLGVFGSPRPLPGSGGAAKELPPKMVKELNEAAQAVEVAKTPQERQAAQQRYTNLYSIAATYMGKVLKPGEIKGNYPGTGSGDPRIDALNAQEQQLLGKMTGDNYEATQAALTNIAGRRQAIKLQGQLQELGDNVEARVGLARDLIGRNATQEALQGLGFTPDEVRAARKPAPLSQTPSGAKVGGSATSQPAAATDTVRYIRTQTPRGSYIYTESPRGMTRAQWAEQGVDVPIKK